MSRKASFWILFAVLSAAALTFAVRLFPRAFPIVSVELRMDRSHAMASARTIAERLRLGPSAPVREATWFGVDDTVKTFVELEGGGAGVFRDMIARHLYEAYTWRVRRFRAGETREVVVRFRPDGTPYGFHEKLREDAPGAALSRDAARTLAETAATRDWGLDLGPYEPVETSMEIQPGRRVDHTFVYQRRDASVGEGRYRVRLVVAGDHLAELTHFLRVPQAFDRRYEKLRASNDAIAFGATVALAVLYIIGGCIIGLVLLMRRRWVVWTPAFVLGVVVAGVQAAASVNGWPLEWMFYDTAVPPSAFLLQRIVQVVLVFLADGGVIMLSFAAAESLGRRAFPHHPQLWSLGSPAARGSRQVLGRTAGGVLLTGIEFGYIIAFYVVVTQLWKWWTPAEALVDPNVLATRLPWLAAFAPSLHAGMWEEALFRAVPLAGAALIGERLGRRKLWIGIGLVVEALVFGCAHANYPSEPAFSRPVELFLPSLVWGVIYLQYGLLPSMITHYLFDLSLFGLPLFTSSAAGNRVDQIALVLVGALPLLLVAGAALRRRALVDLPDSLRNAAWTPPAEEFPELEVLPAPPARTGLTPARARWLVGLGLVGIAAWALLAPFHTDAPGLRVRRAQAVATGEKGLASRGFAPTPRWREMATVDPDDSDEQQGAFVWRALGPEMYHRLIGKDLAPPRWKLRVASFEGDVVERAEEWRAYVDGDGTLRRIRHDLPQGRQGASLDEAAAREIAHRELASRFLLRPDQVREVSAVSERQPSRLDWTFTFADTAPPHLARGERRIAIGIAGDQVRDAHRLVFVPEDWQRQQRGTDTVLGVLALVRALVIAVVVLTGAVLAVIAWSRRALRPGFTLRCFALLAVLGLVIAANRWPQLEANMDTAKPYQLQVSIFVVALILAQLVSAAVIALLAGWVHLEQGRGAPEDARGTSPLHGLALGGILAGVLTLIGLLPAGSPRLPNIDAAPTWLPWLGESLRPAMAMFMRIAILSALLAAARMLSSGWTRRSALVAVLVVVAGGFAAAPGTAATPATWLAQAALAGLGLLAVEWFVLRHDPRNVPWTLATLTILNAVRAFVIAGHPDARLGSVIAAALAALLAAWWTLELVRATAPAPPVRVTEPAA